MRPLMLSQGEGGLTLQAVVQLAGWTGSGGGAKHLIQAGDIRLNGVPELRRSRQVHLGDRVAYQEDEVELVADGH
jgi:ribosome-associated protein